MPNMSPQIECSQNQMVTTNNSEEAPRGKARRCRQHFRLLTTILGVVVTINILCEQPSKVVAMKAAQFSPLLYLPSSSISGRSFKDTTRDLIIENSDAQSRSTRSPSNVCQVKEGESVAILEIEESRNSDMSQSTRPAELPILGSVSKGDIELRIESETHKYFQIQDKRLKLTRPLDRDAILKEPISSIYLQVSCIDRRTDGNNRKVIIPVLVKVLDLNDNAPKFTAQTYTVQVNEVTPIDSIIFDQILAIDLDSANNGLVEYSLLGSRTNIPSSDISERPKFQSDVTSAANSDRSSTWTTPASLTTTPTATEPSSPSFSPSKSEPTINLDNEPIVNGPMEDTEDDDSDEALLAAFNSTEAEGDLADLTGPHVPLIRRTLRRRIGRDTNQKLTTVLSTEAVTTMSNQRPIETSTVSNSQAARDTTTTTRTTTTTKTQVVPTTESIRTSRDERSKLWTNLLAATGTSDDFPIRSTGDSSLSEQSEFFSLEIIANSNKPVIKLKKPLDYETQRVHMLTIVASDRATNPRDRLTSSATLVIRVLDGDDQGPAFILDQSGCATGPFQAPTTSQPEALALSKRSASFDGSKVDSNSMSSEGLHRGFRVTDREDFDFGDSHVSSGLDQELTVSEMPDPLINEEPEQSSSRSRRFQPQVNTQATAGPTISATTKTRLMDYSCLSGGISGNAGQAEYFATVMSGDSDYLLRIAPQAIRARDRDELNAPIRYSFVNGTPDNFAKYFQINPLDASVKQVMPVERLQMNGVLIDKFEIMVQAQEQTANKLFSIAKLTIDVVPTDKSPPTLVPNSYSGFIEENSPIGSNVLISDSIQGAKNFSNLMRISILDGSAMVLSGSNGGNLLRSQSNKNLNQLYEFETTSDAFQVDREGFVYVNRILDRDSPNQQVHIFQVTARQVNLASSRSISSPISINVSLIDLNDNPPILVNSSLVAVQLPATSDSRSIRRFTTIKATDKDSTPNAKMSFLIKHVSNNGKDKFKINQETGELEALGKFTAGDQFSLTLQVEDELGRSSQGILEVQVVPGPNTSGPQFLSAPGDFGPDLPLNSNGRVANNPGRATGYSVEVNEAIAQHSLVLQVQAIDPENDPISYTIVDGNVNNDFYINSRSGTIYTANKLDREEVSAYRLLIQARDSGGLASSRHVYISVADTNDQNPTFSQSHYVFSIEEGTTAPRPLGKVEASDADSGDNGRISYQLTRSGIFNEDHVDVQDKIFDIDSQTGEISILQPLDYENCKSYSLIVTAKDHGENPRSTTASITVKVVDVQDEAPYFERYYYESRLIENVSNQKIAQVQAKDPDSMAKITYVIRSGDSSLFEIDQNTGVVTTLRGLDYEESRSHSLLIGTLEQATNVELTQAAEAITNALVGEPLARSPICRIDITVIDLNDNPPQFPPGQQLPVRIQDSVQLGSQVTKMVAHDADASEPNNQIRYELVAQSDTDSGNQQVTSDECMQFFIIDSSNGQISVKSDLRRSSQSECQLVIRARDLGHQPMSLTSTTSITVHIDHIAEISTNSMIGFADSSYTVEIAENSPANSLVKLLPVINKPKINFPLSCEIISGNEQNRFYVTENEQRDCELKTRDHQLDYEIRTKYSLTLKLNTIGSSSKMTIAQVNVNVLDKNDNKPIFKQVARYSHLTQGKFLAAVSSDSPPESQVIQMRATDLDSSASNGLISYEILNSQENGSIESRFKIDSVDGIVRISKPVEDVPTTRLPVRLRVLARDNPELASDSLETTAELMVNLIDDRHRLVLALKDTPAGRALDSREELLSVIQERTKLIPGLERAESLKLYRNYTIESDMTGTDFCFYLIEPGTFKIITSDDPRVRSSLLESRAQNSLADILSQTLGFGKIKVRLPYTMTGVPIARYSVAALGSPLWFSRALDAGEGAAPALITIGLFIAVVSAIVVICQCGIWSSESRSRTTSEKLFLAQQQQQNRHYQQYGFGMPMAGHNQLMGGSIASKGPLMSQGQDFAGFTSALSTLQPSQLANSRQQLLAGYGGKQVQDLYQMPADGQSALNKEYETQMLKMSVLFDDSNSLDEHNLQAAISKNLSGR